MSARERGSDSWPRLAAFPGDNLELGNAPEEDDVDHHGEAPSWVPGAAAVGTGAGPPGPDETGESQHDGGPAYAAGPDDSDVPGFADFPGTGHGFGEPGLSQDQGGAPGFPAGPDGAGYGDHLAQPPDYGEGAAEAPDFTAPPLLYGEEQPAGTPGFQGGPAAGAIQGDGAGYGDAMGFSAGPGYEQTPAYSDAPPLPAERTGFAPQRRPDFGGPGEPAHQGFTGGQQDGDYPFTGQFRGDFAAAGFGGAVADDGPVHATPGMGDAYGGQGYQRVGNGSQPPGPGFTPRYPPARPPQPPSRISGMTASLRTRRPRAAKAKKKRGRQGVRQAQLTVSRVEPWSVMKFSFVISLVAFIVLFVAVAVLYAVLSGLGVFSALQHTVSNITSSQSSGGFNLMTYISASRVLGYTGLLGAINVVLITALSTVGAVLYNITADLAGGVEVTLKESD